MEAEMTAIETAYGAAVLAVVIYMTAWFLLAQVMRRNDIVDIAWGLGFIMIAVLMLVRQDPASDRLLLVGGLVLVWGLRLAWHIGKRNLGKPEDFRYAQWRRDWGKWFLPRTFLQVFMLQGLFMLMISAPIVLVGANAGRALGWLDGVGAAVWFFGYLFEAVGDAQMAAFKREPANKGKLIDVGLWRYTRHPNYFGEAVQWWGIAIIALSVPRGWVGLLGAMTITTLLLFVSGVPMLERKYAGRPDWEAYKARTSVFVPLPPKKG